MSRTYELILRSSLKPTGQPGNMDHDVPVNSLVTSQTCYEWWPEGSVTTLIAEWPDATMPVRAADAPPAVFLGPRGILLTQEHAPSRESLVRICVRTSLIVANTCSTYGWLETPVLVSTSSRPGRRQRGREGHLFLFYSVTRVTSVWLYQNRRVQKSILRDANNYCLGCSEPLFIHSNHLSRVSGIPLQHI